MISFTRMIAPESTAESDPRQVDDYRILHSVDSEARTFIAHDPGIDRVVLVTMLPDPADASRLRALQACARTAHPNFCGIHRICNGAAGAYVVSAFARGSRLDTLETPLPDDTVFRLGHGLAGALAALHAAGAAHGDVHAGRVVVSDGEPLLFGIEHVCGADRTAREKDVRALRELLASVSAADLRRRMGALLERFEGEPTAEQLATTLEPRAQKASSEPAIE